MIKARTYIAALTLSAAGFVGILNYEGYRSDAYQPVPGDIPTIGFGTTNGVKAGDTITPPAALKRALNDVDKFEGILKGCVTVPLHQHEYDAYVSLAYNIGGTAFCGSTLVRKLNANDYPGACAQVKRWVYFKGKALKGLVNRRASEYLKCMGVK